MDWEGLSDTLAFDFFRDARHHLRWHSHVSQLSLSLANESRTLTSVQNDHVHWQFAILGIPES